MKKFQATLVRGKHYSLGMTTWKAGDTITITEEQKAVLERDAVHKTTTEDGEEVVRQQFKFVEVAEPAPAAPKPQGGNGGGNGNRQRVQGQQPQGNEGGGSDGNQQ